MSVNLMQDDLSDLLQRKKNIFEKIRKISVSSKSTKSSSSSSYQPRKTIRQLPRTNTQVCLASARENGLKSRTIMKDLSNYY